MISLLAKYARLSFALAVLLLWTSCSKDDGAPVPEKAYVEASFIAATQASQIKTTLEQAGIGDLSKKVEYSYDMYRFEYRTTFQDEALIASGLFAAPQASTDPFPMISIQHGTLAANHKAPTESINDYVLFLAAASLGYYVVIPDFVGFGTSEPLLHPYYDESSSAQTVRDMVFAAKEYIEDQGSTFNGNLFLAGYSQGGYVTFAAQKSLESNPLDGVELVASAPAAGAYDVLHMKDHFLSRETYHQPFYISYIVHNYNTYYDWNQPLTDFFQEPYANQIPSLFDGSNTGSQINEALTPVIPDLLQPEMISAFDTDPRYTALKAALEANSLVDWAPCVPTRMYHGTVDITVPYENSVVSYDQLIANGATSLELVPIEGADHGSGIIPYAELVLEWFETLK